LNLRRAGREWRGDCPACGYGGDAFCLTESKGKPLGWCASCQDKSGIARAMFGDRHQAASAPCQDDASEAAKRQGRIERARRLWDTASPAAGTPAETYLALRGLPNLAASPALRFLSACSHPSGAERYPALVASVVDAAGELIAVHRTYLRADGSGKASCEPQKATLGPVAGGAVWLTPVAVELVIGEGLESSASAGLLLGLPAWSAVSAGNLARTVKLPPEVRRVVIAADADDPGERAAREAAWRWQGEGRMVRIARPNQPSQDFNDLIGWMAQ
jgi:phage/plasmid primase-like uncharacterized protein